MGLVICEKHGGQGIILLCGHLYDQYCKTKKINSHYETKKDEIGSTIYLCEFCLQTHNLKDVVQLSIDDLEIIGDELHPVCGKCIN